MVAFTGRSGPAHDVLCDPELRSALLSAAAGTAEPWSGDAACAAMPPQRFFPERGEIVASEARDACASCTVRVQCLAEALVLADKHGFRAGTTPDQRAKLRAAAIAAGLLGANGAPTGSGVVWEEPADAVREERSERAPELAELAGDAVAAGRTPTQRFSLVTTTPALAGPPVASVADVEVVARRKADGTWDVFWRARRDA